MQENGDLQEIYMKWWIKENKIPNKVCDPHDEDLHSTHELDFEDVGGAFVLMGLGVIISSIIAIFEFLHMAKKTSNEIIDFKKNIKQGFQNSVQNIMKNEFRTPFKKDNSKYNFLATIARRHARLTLNHDNLFNNISVQKSLQFDLSINNLNNQKMITY
jgi:hypothetical protein